MAKTRIGSNAIYSGNQLGLSIIGDHCYAYNEKGCTNTDITLLKFSTGKYYIVAKVQFGYVENAANSFDYSILFNGNSIAGYLVGGAGTQANDNQDNAPLNIIIPPLTDVQITAKNISSADERDQIATLTGRVYA